MVSKSDWIGRSCPAALRANLLSSTQSSSCEVGPGLTTIGPSALRRLPSLTKPVAATWTRAPRLAPGLVRRERSRIPRIASKECFRELGRDFLPWCCEGIADTEQTEFKNLRKGCAFCVYISRRPDYHDNSFMLPCCDPLPVAGERTRAVDKRLCFQDGQSGPFRGCNPSQKYLQF